MKGVRRGSDSFLERRGHLGRMMAQKRRQTLTEDQMMDPGVRETETAHQASKILTWSSRRWWFSAATQARVALDHREKLQEVPRRQEVALEEAVHTKRHFPFVHPDQKLVLVHVARASRDVP